MCTLRFWHRIPAAGDSRPVGEDSILVAEEDSPAEGDIRPAEEDSSRLGERICRVNEWYGQSLSVARSSIIVVGVRRVLGENAQGRSHSHSQALTLGPAQEGNRPAGCSIQRLTW